jgi:alkaline phosphatase D
MRPRFRYLTSIAAAIVAIQAAFAQLEIPSKKQGAPPEAYLPGDPLPFFGSEDPWNRRAFARPHDPNESGRIGQAQILDLIENREEDALASCLEWLDRDTSDGESRFNLVLTLARLGRMEEAERELETLLALGFPPERFLAGPRSFTAPLHTLDLFKTRIVGKTYGLVHGPTLGAVMPGGIRVWVRTEKESEVEVRVVQDWDFTNTVAVASGRTNAVDDFTGVVQLNGLKPETFYRYRLFVDGTEVPRRPEWSFRTTPDHGSRQPVRIAFGSCAHYTPEYERIWDTIRLRRPQVFLTLGDNVYIDLAGKVNALHDYTYYCRQSRPEWRRLAASTPIYAVWDDHDCVIDDVFMGPYVDRPSWKLGHFRVFRRNWNNPSYGAEPEWPATWFNFRLGPVEVFMLDGRFYRENWRRPGASMLGPIQKAWLLDALEKSTAVFKILASPVAWADDAKTATAGGDAYDTWYGHRDEREEIFDFIFQNGINGVLLISGDRHRTDVRVIRREHGYPLYELESGRLTNANHHEPHGETLFAYTKTQTFALLDFDVRSRNPVAGLGIANIDGEIVWNREVSLSELTVPAPP